jgi:pimeloyl-ACP methyl ester carboxylesterase
MTYTPLRPPRHEQLNIRGLKHRLTWWGAPTDDPVILLHGFQDCGATWQFLADCLPGWSLVAPDWRGFGGTEWAPGGYWFPDYLADLDALLNSLAPKGAARMVAHSMGANIAMLYGGIRPHRLKWLVNLEGIGLRRTRPDEAPGRYAQWLDQLAQPLNEGRYDSVEQLADVLMKRNPRLRPDRAQFVARAWTRDNGDGVCLMFDPRHRFVNPVLYRREEAEACWARFEAPLLLIAGEVSAHQKRRLSDFSEEYMHGLFPQARVVTLPGVGHMMQHEDPEAVAGQIVRFAQECA